MKKVVVIGGGNGSSLLIEALKNIEDVDLTALITVTDSGGSSGKLIKEFENILPPGDLLRAILSMASDYKYKDLRETFYSYRKDGHNLGNLFLSLYANYKGSFKDALEFLQEAFKVKGKVLPISWERSDLVCRLDNGEELFGEHTIDRPVGYGGVIEEIWIEPKINISDESRSAIKDADYIFFAPGSLYCSVIANLLVEGVKECLSESNAKLVCVVSRAFEKDGELGPRSLRGYVEVVEKYLPKPLDEIVFSNADFSEEVLKIYEEKDWGLLNFDDKFVVERKMKVVDLDSGGVGIHPEKTREAFKEFFNF